MAKSTKGIDSQNGELPKVALKSPVVKENLPLPYVHYPNHYGTFFMFSNAPKEQLYFCKCNKVAIQNSLELKQKQQEDPTKNYSKDAPLPTPLFPKEISEESLEKDLSKLLKFKEKVCHRCNLATPSLRYCHEMYGGNFKQYFGWYINQTQYRLGITKFDYIRDYAPDELIEEIDSLNKKFKKRNSLAQELQEQNDLNNPKLSTLDKQIRKLKRKITKRVENVTREEFGFRKIGEGNVSETILTKIVKRIFPSYEVIRHHRPNWLEGLELDIFLPKLSIGIEYQGQQHYHPVEAWGGKEALKDLKKRDKRKKEICDQNGIDLIEVDYTEPLQEEYIRQKLEYYIS